MAKNMSKLSYLDFEKFKESKNKINFRKPLEKNNFQRIRQHQLNNVILINDILKKNKPLTMPRNYLCQIMNFKFDFKWTNRHIINIELNIKINKAKN